jgi:hypothetical protein
VTGRRALRIAAAAAAAPLGMGAYLSFSPRRDRVPAAAWPRSSPSTAPRSCARDRVALGRRGARGAAALVRRRAPLHAGHATAQGLAVLALLAVVARCAARRRPGDAPAPLRLRAPRLSSRWSSRSRCSVRRGGPRRARPPRATAFGATNARRRTSAPSPDYWRVAVDVAADHPIAGAGPGAFAVEWLRRRTIDERVRNAHSLELQTLADLGLVGLALLAATVAAIALAARSVLRADRALAAGPAAAALTWALHAGLDWDWEMPAVTPRVRPLAPASGRRGGRR